MPQDDAEVAEVLRHLGCMLALPPNDSPTSGGGGGGGEAEAAAAAAAPLDCVLHVVLGPHELPKGAMIVDHGMPSKSKAAKLAKRVDELASRSAARHATSTAAPATPPAMVSADVSRVASGGTSDAALSVPHAK